VQRLEALRTRRYYLGRGQGGPSCATTAVARLEADLVILFDEEL
jgi:hypothetical protein